VNVLFGSSNILTLVDWGLIWRTDPLVVADNGSRGQVGGGVQGRLGALEDLGQRGVLNLGNSSLSGADTNKSSSGRKKKEK